MRKPAVNRAHVSIRHVSTVFDTFSAASEPMQKRCHSLSLPREWMQEAAFLMTFRMLMGRGWRKTFQERFRKSAKAVVSDEGGPIERRWAEEGDHEGPRESGAFQLATSGDFQMAIDSIGIANAVGIIGTASALIKEPLGNLTIASAIQLIGSA
jgi:hypothetical protein